MARASNDDPALRKFEDLEQPYPGRRKPVNREKPETASTDTELWDAHPTFYVVAGEKREFFYIGALAKAIGYSVQAIRLWEGQGLMPNTPFRSPTTKGKPQAGGRSHRGKRLWTREQIEGILRLAKKHRVILPGRSGVRNPPTPAFARDVARLFNELVE
jgi:hypothetical protein